MHIIIWYSLFYISNLHTYCKVYKCVQILRSTYIRVSVGIQNKVQANTVNNLRSSLKPFPTLCVVKIIVTQIAVNVARFVFQQFLFYRLRFKDVHFRSKWTTILYKKDLCTNMSCVSRNMTSYKVLII